MIIEITVPLIVVTVFLLITLGVIIYLLVSKSRKKIIKKAKKQGLKEKQIILGRGYKEINDLKKEFKREKETAFKSIEAEHQRLDYDKHFFEKMSNNLNLQAERLNNRDAELVAHQKQLDFLNAQLIQELENVSGLKKEEAKRKIMKSVEKSLTEEMNLYLREQEKKIRLTAKQKAADILLEAMEKY
jgi:ribonuclease Y